MPRILIIDDDANLRRALAIRLGAAGFEVLTAEHPEAALKTVVREPPALILLDIDMPRMSGLEFHHCIQMTNRARDVPVIYVSGNGTQANRDAAMRQGARAFIAKPFNADDLLCAVRGVLETASAA